MAQGADGRYFLYPLAGGAPRQVPWLSPSDLLYPWDMDGRSVLVTVGSSPEIPTRVEQLDLTTGRRKLFAALGTANRVGLLSCRLTDIADDHQSYAFDTWRMLSTLFLVEPEKRSQR